MTGRACLKQILLVVSSSLTQIFFVDGLFQNYIMERFVRKLADSRGSLEDLCVLETEVMKSREQNALSFFILFLFCPEVLS